MSSISDTQNYSNRTSPSFNKSQQHVCEWDTIYLSSVTESPTQDKTKTDLIVRLDLTLQELYEKRKMKSYEVDSLSLIENAIDLLIFETELTVLSKHKKDHPRRVAFDFLCRAFDKPNKSTLLLLTPLLTANIGEDPSETYLMSRNQIILFLLEINRHVRSGDLSQTLLSEDQLESWRNEIFLDWMNHFPTENISCDLHTFLTHEIQSIEEDVLINDYRAVRDWLFGLRDHFIFHKQPQNLPLTSFFTLLAARGQAPRNFTTLTLFSFLKIQLHLWGEKKSSEQLHSWLDQNPQDPSSAVLQFVKKIAPRSGLRHGNHVKNGKHK